MSLRDAIFKDLRRTSLFAVAILVFLGIVVFSFVRWANTGIENLNGAKSIRQTFAVVRKKERVRFDNSSHSYVDDLGQVVNAEPGAEQLRVYYEIENFIQEPEPIRTSLNEAERKRVADLGWRFRVMPVSQESEYQNMNVGDRLRISYRVVGDEKEIVSMTKEPR